MGRKEEALVGRIRTIFDVAPIAVAIGDDAAVLEVAGPIVVTNDLLVEDVDFTRMIPMEMIGRKALAANLSDLAAMGARPLHFVLALAIPHDLLGEIDRLLQAMAELARSSGITLIGGDLSSAAKLTISITAFGATPRPLLRSGAQPGDRIYVSRPLGGSAVGLHLLGAGWSITASGDAQPPDSAALGYALREFGAAAMRHHCAPAAEVELGVRLGAIDQVTACLDISDGLSTDLHRLCAASSVGADIEWERVPLFPDLMQSGRALGVSPEEAALHGGEEFALLFTSSLRESELSQMLGRPVYAIGRIRRDPGVTLFRGEASVPLGDHGFDHFA
jgi:thiamine-monophosphate kinase